MGKPKKKMLKKEKGRGVGEQFWEKLRHKGIMKSSQKRIKIK